MNYTYFDYKLHTTVLLRSLFVVGFTNLSSFMTCNRIFSRTNPRGVTGGTGTANPSRVDSCFCVSQSFVFCEGNLSTIVFFSFFPFLIGHYSLFCGFGWPLCYLRICLIMYSPIKMQLTKVISLCKEFFLLLLFYANCNHVSFTQRLE